MSRRKRSKPEGPRRVLADHRGSVHESAARETRVRPSDAELTALEARVRAVVPANKGTSRGVSRLKVMTNATTDPAPADRYPTPQALLEDTGLSDDDKHHLLNEWEDDIRAKLVASEEGMTGPVTVTLDDVLKAKEQLPIDTPQRPSDAKA